MGTMSKTLHTQEYQKLVKWLVKSRLERGFTVRQLAQRLDVAHSYVGKVEKCERRLDILEYTNYCKALGISPSKGIRTLQKK